MNGNVVQSSRLGFPLASLGEDLASQGMKNIASQSMNRRYATSISVCGSFCSRLRTRAGFLT